MLAIEDKHDIFIDTILDLLPNKAADFKEYVRTYNDGLDGSDKKRGQTLGSFYKLIAKATF